MREITLNGILVSCITFGTIVILAFIVCGAELLSPLYTYAPFDSGIRYPYLLELFKEQFGQGIWYPRWLYSLYGGYGYPTFLIYYPGYWYFALPISYLFEDAAQAIKVVRFISLIALFGGFYALGRFYGCTRVSVLAVLPFFALIVQPMNWHYSPCIAFMWSVWGIYFYLLSERRMSDGKAFYLPLCLYILMSIGVVYTHAIVTVFYVFIIAGLSSRVFSLTPDARKKILITQVYCALLVLALTSPFWLTSLHLSSYVAYTDAQLGNMSPFWRFANQGERGWGFLANYMNCRGFTYWRGVMEAVALFFFWTLRRKVEWVTLFICHLLSLFLVTEWSLPVWRIIKPLQVLQFPDRIFEFTTLTGHMAILAGIGLWAANTNKENSHRRFIYCLVVLIAAFLLNIFAYRPINIIPNGVFAFTKICPAPGMGAETDYARYKKYLDTKKGFLTFQGQNELRPRSSSTAGLKDRHIEQIPIIELETPEFSAHRLTILSGNSAPWFPIQGILEATNDRARVIINQFYFPGWEITVNGKKVALGSQDSAAPALLRLTPDGRMELQFLVPGTYSINAYYEGPPYWRIRNISILIVIVFLAYSYRRFTRGFSEVTS